jgi:hypothetical protein
MLNPFFQQGSSSEQNLIQDLINEQLRMYGIEIYYIPRKYITKKSIIKEVIQSKFDSAYPIEAYIENYEGYGNVGTILSKFGIQDVDDLTLIISKERFETYISPLIKNLPNVELSTRPKEGDLIYFPLGDRLFEIKYIEHEKPFYQLQKNYVYELRCELFRYEDEIIDTDVSEIDDNITDQGYIQTLTLVGTAITAIAVAGIVDGAVRYVNVTNRGSGYTSAPKVAISSAPTGGIHATGIATMIGGIIDCPGTKSLKVQGVQLTNAGAGYTVAPKVVFNGGGGSGAIATVGLSQTGAVGVITVSSGGSGYTSPPIVTISAPKHVGASAIAIIDSPVVAAGVSVVSATVSVGASAYLFPGGTTGGVFYKTAPTVTFALPTGSGNAATAVATLDNYNLTGGTVNFIGITSGGKFYSSAPTITIDHPGFSYASATIDIGGGVNGSSIDPSLIAFSTTGRAYTTAPVVSIGTGGIYGSQPPTQVAIGIATIHPVTGIVTAVGFSSVTDAWCIGTGATIGFGYTVAPSITFSGNPSPVRATATATISIAGTVSNISIGNSGFGYVTVPTVSIQAPVGVDEQFRARGVALMRFNSVVTSGTIGIGSTEITGINTSNILVGDRVRLGIGYSDNYNFIPDQTYVTSIGSSIVYISSTSTNVGIATSIFEFGIDQCGIVTGIAVTFGGGGYLFAPEITISNEVAEKNYVEIIPGISTARAAANINSAGIVTSINILDTGFGYILTPEVTVEAPYSLGSGTFKFNETVTGSVSGTTARVNSWDSTINQLEVSIISGSFVSNEIIVGQESGASYKLRVLNTDNLVDPYADNDNIEVEADTIIDFSESNPFGMP